MPRPLLIAVAALALGLVAPATVPAYAASHPKPQRMVVVTDAAGDVTGATSSKQRAIDVRKVVYAFVADYDSYGPAVRIHVGFRGRVGYQSGKHHVVTRFFAGGQQYVLEMNGDNAAVLSRESEDGELRRVSSSFFAFSYAAAGNMEVVLDAATFAGARQINGFTTRMFWGDGSARDRTRKSGPLALR